MAEQPPASQPPAAPQALANLHAIAQLLREGQHLDPEEQRLLGELVDELAKALDSTHGPSPELVRLADSAVHLLQVVHQRHDGGLLAAARTRLEETLAEAEARAPVLVGFARRLMEALAGSGI
jgi:hypothetical protein